MACTGWVKKLNCQGKNKRYAQYFYLSWKAVSVKNCKTSLTSCFFVCLFFYSPYVKHILNTLSSPILNDYIQTIIYDHIVKRQRQLVSCTHNCLFEIPCLPIIPYNLVNKFIIGTGSHFVCELYLSLNSDINMRIEFWYLAIVQHTRTHAK